MILAAGLGTRLRPITDRLPKALVLVGGRTLLETTLDRLVDAGCDRIVVNVHHHADRIESFLASSGAHVPSGGEGRASRYRWRGADVLVSREPDEPLDTGGGIKHARHLFRGDRTILVHNVDVLSGIDLPRLVRAHESSDALATLAVSRRPASRYLVFDGAGLCGRIDARTGGEEWARKPREPTIRVGFTGIHALAPRMLNRITEAGVFSIVRTYLRLAAEGASVMPVDVTGEQWIDVGTPGRLAEARSVWGTSP
jgi:NDP-sugar pyrophosphorylase family protein